jgi:hypothetical protein
MTHFEAAIEGLAHQTKLIRVKIFVQFGLKNTKIVEFPNDLPNQPVHLSIQSGCLGQHERYQSAGAMAMHNNSLAK